ncbi:hypothetical protein, partial [Treponema phagedenis]|uniref:hypothetical protein n=1 Tax=Treponema phagedenis TaxID=162 RepID=UPI001C06D99E
NYLQSFKTRRCSFCHGRRWFQAEASLKTTTAYSEFSNSWFSFCHGRQKSEPPWTAMVPRSSEF